VIFLTLDDICEINREWIQRYGGRYVAVDKNLCNRASLEYILTAIQYPIFGVQRFPRLIDKASALAWWIIEGHVFNDGNKRTGMQAAIELLELNGVMTSFDTESVIEISLDVANGRISVEELADLISHYLEHVWGDPYQVW
jgi:death-on-curing protein